MVVREICARIGLGRRCVESEKLKREKRKRERERESKTVYMLY